MIAAHSFGKKAADSLIIRAKQIQALSLFLLAAFVSIPCVMQAQSPDMSPVPPVPQNASVAPANPSLPTIFIVGDSTASFHEDPQKEGVAASQGWGPYFPRYFDLSRVNVVNAARGGRSSRTFRSEGLWDQVLDQVRPGDIVLIQLGQNDVFAINDTTRARGTIPGVGSESKEIDNQLTHKHETVHTFGWYITQYVIETKSKGAIPIVMSLTPRDIWKDGHMERGAPSYRDWSRAVAEEQHVDFVDISEAMAREYEKLGQRKTATLYHNGEPVHVNTIGAALNAEWIVQAFSGMLNSPLKPYLAARNRAVSPSK